MPKNAKFPVIFPVSREFGLGDWFRRAASTTKQSSETRTVELASKKAAFAASSCDFFEQLFGRRRRTVSLGRFPGAGLRRQKSRSKLDFSKGTKGGVVECFLGPRSVSHPLPIVYRPPLRFDLQ